MNPTHETFLISMGKRLESQQDEITEVRLEVQFLKNKLSDVERYQPKDYYFSESSLINQPERF